ncbi:BREX protein BrxB domain-containing protein [Aminobacter aminovorans]|uniref:BREX protein BrxB domain-containing protein n=1 Tax=Aminobacter aminovorans TaxID=83263 RepID=UPI00285CC02C|nr:BREX protein BrxB domain-containing protein [Aminobacter aminovorans]MDR7225209.1 hypothetical protein [Aminobacter aminovorans]
MMSKIDRLAQIFGRHIAIGWPASSSGAQRVIMVVYDPADERLLRRKLDVFAQEAIAAGKAWAPLDLTQVFGKWLAIHRYREVYFEEPEELEALGEDRIALTAAALIESALRDSAHGPDAVLGVFGVGSLYGFASVSEVLSRVEHAIRGRLVVFFPGHVQDGRYRLLDARESWDYHAVPITLDASGDT